MSGIVVSPTTSMIVSSAPTAQVIVTTPLPVPIFRTMQPKVVGDNQDVVVGDNKLIFAIPTEFDGMNLVDAQAYVTTASTSGTPTVQVRNITKSNVDMLSTRVTIDEGEFTSYTAAVVRVINLNTDNVSLGDLISIDVDFAGTGAKGLGVILRFS
jgi:hypothetical protein